MNELTRFWSKVNKTAKCWEWIGALDKKGYGRFNYNGKIVYAHRYSYSIANNPGSLPVLHHCGNPKCVRPDHLFLGTQADNIADCAIKDRLSHGSRNPAAKLTEQAVMTIRERYAKGGISQMALAKEYGVCAKVIWGILTRRKWKRV